MGAAGVLPFLLRGDFTSVGAIALACAVSCVISFALVLVRFGIRDGVVVVLEESAAVVFRANGGRPRPRFADDGAGEGMDGGTSVVTSISALFVGGTSAGTASTPFVSTFALLLGLACGSSVTDSASTPGCTLFRPEIDALGEGFTTGAVFRGGTYRERIDLRPDVGCGVSSG